MFGLEETTRNFLSSLRFPNVCIFYFVSSSQDAISSFGLIHKFSWSSFLLIDFWFVEDPVNSICFVLDRINMLRSLSDTMLRRISNGSPHKIAVNFIIKNLYFSTR